jgi:multiple sugar transport system substrate-binding protein
MNMSKQTGWSASVLLAAIVFLTSCGSNGASSGAPEAAKPAETKPPEPVTLTSTVDGVNIDDAWLNQIKTELAKKYPYITLEFILSVKGNTLADMVATGRIPDIVFTHDGRIAPLQQYGMLEDISPLIKQHNFDLKRFDPQYLDIVKEGASDGKLYAIPLDSKYHAMYYNKDIFDKFGVAYPRDGMTVNDTVELAKKVSRVEGGTVYHGLNTGSNMIWIAQARNLFTVDRDKPTVNTDGWKQMFELGKTIYTIPGNEWDNTTPKKQFYEQRKLAMFMFQNMFDELGTAMETGFNWDVVQYPSFPEYKNIYPSASTDVILISNTSKHKEAALKVIEAATSDEVQMTRSKQGIVSVLGSDAIKKAFATDLKFLQGKNIQGIFKSKPAAAPPISEYRQDGEKIVRAKFLEYLDNKADVNSLLRQAEEEIKQVIQAGNAK